MLILMRIKKCLNNEVVVANGKWQMIVFEAAAASLTALFAVLVGQGKRERDGTNDKQQFLCLP